MPEDVYYLSVIFLMVLVNVIIYVNMQQIKMLMSMSIMDPKNNQKSKPLKSSKLSYNPSDLFNPYNYTPEDDMDPVSPGDETKPTKKKKKTEY